MKNKETKTIDLNLSIKRYRHGVIEVYYRIPKCILIYNYKLTSLERVYIICGALWDCRVPLFAAII